MSAGAIVLGSKGNCDRCRKPVEVRAGEAWHSKGEKVWHELCSYQQQLELGEKVRVAAHNLLHFIWESNYDEETETEYEQAVVALRDALRGAGVEERR